MGSSQVSSTVGDYVRSPGTVCFYFPFLFFLRHLLSFNQLCPHSSLSFIDQQFYELAVEKIENSFTKTLGSSLTILLYRMQTCKWYRPLCQNEESGKQYSNILSRKKLSTEFKSRRRDFSEASFHRKLSIFSIVLVCEHVTMSFFTTQTSAARQIIQQSWWKQAESTTWSWRLPRSSLQPLLFALLVNTVPRSIVLHHDLIRAHIS